MKKQKQTMTDLSQTNLKEVVPRDGLYLIPIPIHFKGVR